MQNLVAPRLLHAVKHAWNPLNRRQSAAVASVHRDLLVYLQPTDPLLQVRSARAAPICVYMMLRVRDGGKCQTELSEFTRWTLDAPKVSRHAVLT